MKKLDTNTMISSKESPAKEMNHLFLFTKLIIATTYIPKDCTPQIKAEEYIGNTIETHYDSMRDKNNSLG